MRHCLSAFILWPLAALLLASCASRQAAATLLDVETYIQERPDSALATLRSIDTTTITTPKLRAHYALLHAMALDKISKNGNLINHALYQWYWEKVPGTTVRSF